MQGRACFCPSRSACRLLVWCLLFTLPVGVLSSAMIEMLGASHFHREAFSAASAMDGWQDFRRPRVQGGVRPVHSHLLLQRHHHTSGDETVVALDRDGSEALSGETASSPAAPIWLMFASAGCIELQAPALTLTPWPQFGPRPIKNWDSQPLERPPRA